MTPADATARRAINPGVIYRVAEAAGLAGMHAVTLRNKLRDGTLKGRRARGGQWRILGSEILKLSRE